MAEQETPASPAGAGFSAPAGADALLLQQLAHVTTELGAAETMEAVIEASVNHMAGAIRAAVTTLMLRDGDQLVLVAGHNLQPGTEDRWSSFPVAANNPASEAARTGRPVYMADVARIEERYPSLRGQVPAGRSVVDLPLGAGGRPVGVLGLTFDGGWLPGPQELDFLTTFAEATGQAIRRVRAMDEAREKTRQLTFLADASLALSSSLDYRSTLTNVAQLAVPTLADWCSVSVVQENGPATLAVAHMDPAKVAWAWELEERYPPDPDALTGPSNVIRTGRSELYSEISDEMLVAGAHDEEHLRLSRELNLRSALVVPLSARGRTLGAITLVRAESMVRYTEADLAVAEDLGRRAGVAIDNAILHGQAQDVALQLQRAVLPERLEIPGWDIASHYAPGGSAEVGGDFYDAVDLSDGRLALFIGDVMGHGLAAAAAMAHMRAAVRAFLSSEPDPSDVIAQLDTMFTRLGLKQLVTLVYAVLDPAAGQLTIANAGHLRPIVVAATGQAEFARLPTRRPLGAGGDDRTATVLRVAPDETLLFYTDGLVERRGEGIQEGLARLLLGAGVLAERDLQLALTQLVGAAGDCDGDDDVTALAIRAAPADGFGRFAT
ncbi:MAG: hypothetical protein JWP39_827 [Jatrophihabitans sp.]|nr:hypothetical protein [Jatrophihabitans sp.]